MTKDHGPCWACDLHYCEPGPDQPNMEAISLFRAHGVNALIPLYKRCRTHPYARRLWPARRRTVARVGKSAGNIDAADVCAPAHEHRCPTQHTHSRSRGPSCPFWHIGQCSAHPMFSTLRHLHKTCHCCSHAKAKMPRHRTAADKARAKARPWRHLRRAAGAAPPPSTARQTGEPMASTAAEGSRAPRPPPLTVYSESRAQPSLSLEDAGESADTYSDCSSEDGQVVPLTAPMPKPAGLPLQHLSSTTQDHAIDIDSENENMPNRDTETDEEILAPRPSTHQHAADDNAGLSETPHLLDAAPESGRLSQATAALTAQHVTAENLPCINQGSWVVLTTGIPSQIFHEYICSFGQYAACIDLAGGYAVHFEDSAISYQIRRELDGMDLPGGRCAVRVLAYKVCNRCQVPMYNMPQDQLPAPPTPAPTQVGAPPTPARNPVGAPRNPGPTQVGAAPTPAMTQVGASPTTLVGPSLSDKRQTARASEVCATHAVHGNHAQDLGGHSYHDQTCSYSNARTAPVLSTSPAQPMHQTKSSSNAHWMLPARRLYRLMLLILPCQGEVTKTARYTQQPSPKTPAPNWIVKRAYKRAVKQANRAGVATYRGKQYSAEALQAQRYRAPIPKLSLARQAKALTPRPFLHVTSHNIGGATTLAYDEWSSWLSQNQPHIALLQETHWGDSSEFNQGRYHAVGSGGPERCSGLLTAIHHGIASPQQISFNEWIPGRLLHVRVRLRQQTWDIVNVYQVPWRRTCSEAVNVKNRKPLWGQLDTLLGPKWSYHRRRL